jgi:D-alanyl-D-alanine carboxypeptidase (penicillin-binding protein 5/6)
MMNEKAEQLGMTNTHFENACGLDTDNHLTTARDIAVMSRYLIVNYPQIKEFTTKWQDTIIHNTARGSTEFGLTNTNKLIKQYPYATGLKTGSTSKALYCLSATAEKDGLSLIAVIMASPDPKARFSEASKLLDYGFTNYSIANGREAGTSAGTIKIFKGKQESAEVYIKDKVSLVVKKGNNTALTEKTELSEGIQAPVKSGAKVGEIIYYCDGNEVGRSDITVKDSIEKATMGDMIKRLAKNWFL